MLVKILDLAGKDVAGKAADLRTRNADGTLRYEHTADEQRAGKLLSVEIQKRKDGDWLEWRWDKIIGMKYDCGYSGIRLDRNDVNEYYLEVV